MKAIMAIDPGIDGGLALLGDCWADLEVMPVVTRTSSTKYRKDGSPQEIRSLDIKALAEWVSARRDETELAIVEIAGMRAKLDVATVAKAWRGFGAIEAVLVCMGVPHRLVEPAIWSAEFDHGVTLPQGKARYEAIKKARKSIAAGLWPTLDLRGYDKSRTAHEGIVDALLIAEWGRRQLTRGIIL